MKNRHGKSRDVRSQAPALRETRCPQRFRQTDGAAMRRITGKQRFPDRVPARVARVVQTGHHAVERARGHTVHDHETSNAPPIRGARFAGAPSRSSGGCDQRQRTLCPPARAGATSARPAPCRHPTRPRSLPPAIGDCAMRGCSRAPRSTPSGNHRTRKPGQNAPRRWHRHTRVPVLRPARGAWPPPARHISWRAVPLTARR